VRWNLQHAGNTARGIGVVGAFLLSFLLCAFAIAQESGSGQQKEKLPQSVAPQPIAFSHKTHATDVGLPCNFCHTGVDKGDDAEIPSADFCMKCHQTVKADSPDVAKIRTAAEKGKTIAWVPIYTVPDFVFFGHSTHIKAGLKCAECHGPVETRDVLQKEVSTGMNSCRDCHQRRGARADCAACHQLGY
jgi:Cytochrome c7 and related cytochrome c